jgi:hypothetical protein
MMITVRLVSAIYALCTFVTTWQCNEPTLLIHFYYLSFLFGNNEECCDISNLVPPSADTPPHL